jgi:hypothetical protein
MQASRSRWCCVISARPLTGLGASKTDEKWSEQLEAALTATRRDDLQHGTNAAYVHGCVCRECREHQRVRMTQNRKPLNAT